MESLDSGSEMNIMAAKVERNTNGKAAERSHAPRDIVPPGVSRKPKVVPTWDRVKLARHPDRPHTLDYIQRLCTVRPMRWM